jgi:hypothetical protein
MNSGRGAFQGSWPWLSSLPSFFGFKPTSRHLHVGVGEAMPRARVDPDLKPVGQPRHGSR